MRRFLMSAILTALMSTVYAQVPRDGLLAWYPFTGTFEDLSGHGHDLTVFEDRLPEDTTDRYDSSDAAFWFSNSSIAPYVEDSWLPSGDRAWSVCAWTFPIGNTMCVVSWGIQEEPNKKVSITQIPTPSLSGCDLCVSNGTDSIKTHYWSASWEWYHIAVTHDSNTTKIYINGEEKLSADIDLSIENGSYLGIGGETVKDDRFIPQDSWEGKLDDIAIYNKTLTGAQVSAIYQAKTSLNTPPTITSEPEEVTYVEMIYTYEIVANDAEGHDISYHLLEGPAGSEITGNVLSCNTTGLELTDYPIKIAAVDALGDFSYQEYTLTVTAAVSVEKPARTVPKYHAGFGSSLRENYFTVTGRSVKSTKGTSGIYLRSHKVLVLDR